MLVELSCTPQETVTLMSNVFSMLKKYTAFGIISTVFRMTCKHVLWEYNVFDMRRV